MSTPIINNTGLTEQGKVGHPELDGVTFERGSPLKSDIAGEVCQSLNDTWGYSDEDIMFKSPLEHIKCIASCRSKGCNYLLNVGPLADGSLGLIERGLIKKIGFWMKKYGEAVYDVLPADIITGGNAVAVQKPDCYYVFCFDTPMGADPNVTFSKPNSFVSLRKLDCSHALWLDNDEPIRPIEHDNETLLPVIPFPYGTSLGVRVAKLFKRNL